MTNRYICIHGHFYQPPRENPWLEEVEIQDSAYPYHDWNSRITAECYAPNASSRIFGNDGRIQSIVNNYSRISFNFGPTLLMWLEKHDPLAYQGILDADKKSRERYSGHGSALAQVYNHIIMPLANRRDKETQIIWGIRDFEHRFKRYPEGMWLAETAVDTETLELLADHNIKFTILAPNQAAKIKKLKGKEWIDVSGGQVDPKRPYLCHLPSGKTISLFFYDGPISQQIAFEKLLESGERFSGRLLSVFSESSKDPELVHIATDGETYGHHHRYGDMALAYCLHHLISNDLANITIYAEYLEKFPPTWEAQIHENSSWSCVHGVERWKANCGCNSGMRGNWNQEWRAPLRGALDWLRDNLTEIYEQQAGELVSDIWALRNDYIHVVLSHDANHVHSLLSKYAKKELTPEEKVKILKLLEMQRHELLMYTSCGWFFDEISGIETVQVMNYAARAIQIAKNVSNISLQDSFKGLLQRAPSNLPELQNGSVIYQKYVEPQILDLLRVGVHYAVSSLFSDLSATEELYVYQVERLAYEQLKFGKHKLALGKVYIKSRLTWEEEEVSFAVLHMGDHNVTCGARSFQGEEAYKTMTEQVSKAFLSGATPDVILLMNSHFPSHHFSLWYLFRDEQRKVVNLIFDEARKEIVSSLGHVYEHHSSILHAAEGYNVVLPELFQGILPFLLNTQIKECLLGDKLDQQKLKHIIQETKRFSIRLDIDALGLLCSNRINASVEECFRDSTPRVEIMEEINELIKLIGELNLILNLWKAENIYFSLGPEYAKAIQNKQNASPEDKRVFEAFTQLGECLRIKLI
ncbi:MAG: DUF3536 domain-containing protein [Candidatus Omnitrophica bacterium]|nr:DUF3536 domain-containing protein [Candidatus Omnitrophota bacterium]